MRKLRKNASLAGIAAHARARALVLHSAWLGRNEVAKTRVLSFDERARMDMAWNHFSDVDELASHLERLSKEEEE